MEKRFMTPAAVMAFAKGDLKNFVAASTPGGIEAQEAAGATKLRNGNWLPKQRVGIEDLELIELGFELGGDIDDLFISYKLPEGWTKRGDSDYWTTLVDEKGTPRFGIFYKAAFYDRRARMSRVTA